jgi:hypothetical protein
MAMDVDKTLQQVLRQLEAERGLLDQRIAAVRAVVDGSSRSTSVAEAPRRRRMSPAARREVSRRMKRYWAKRRAGDTKAGAARTQEAARAGEGVPRGPRRSGSNKTASRKKTASRAAAKRRARAKGTRARSKAATPGTQT